MAYLPGGILIKIDWASMVQGLELRSPLLAPLEAEFAARLPERMQVKVV